MTRTLNTLPGSGRGLDSAHRRRAQPSPRHIRHLPRNRQGAASPPGWCGPLCKLRARPRGRRTIMADEPGTPNATILLRSTAIFRELSNEQLAEIWSRAKIHNLLRGDFLFRQHTPSDSVYIVVSGRFEVRVEGKGRRRQRDRRRRVDRRGRLFLRRSTHGDDRRRPRLRACSSSIGHPSTTLRATCRRSIRSCCARWPAGSPTSARAGRAGGTARPPAP